MAIRNLARFLVDKWPFLGCSVLGCSDGFWGRGVEIGIYAHIEKALIIKKGASCVLPGPAPARGAPDPRGRRRKTNAPIR